MLKLFCSITIIELILLNKPEKLTEHLNKSSPTLCIKEQIVSLKNIILSQIHKEEFMQIPKNISLSIKLVGRSVCVISKCESSKRAE